MNFVIFSRNFYPSNDPEAYCATRFASSLAVLGHAVHVVCAPPVGRPATYERLLHRDVKISVVDVEYKRSRFPYVDFRNLLVLDGDASNVREYCSSVNRVLAQYENPILITRSMPLVSLVVGWKCRNRAALWISHISDPVPWIVNRNPLSVLQEMFTKIWLRLSFKDAGATSLTCIRAKRFYEETLGRVVSRHPVFVTPHIGDNKLDAEGITPVSKCWNGKMLLHSGGMYNGRGVSVIQAVDDLNDEGMLCTLVQDRQVDSTVSAWFDSKKHHAIILKDSLPLKPLRAMKAADAALVVDFNRDLSYSPYLMSKLVYQIWGDKPIVVVAKKDSEKHDICMRFPEAGLYFGEEGNLESIKSAIRNAFDSDISAIDRKRIRYEYSEGKIAADFINAVKELINA